MDINKKIAVLQDEILKLREIEQSKLIESFPNIVGKFYRPSMATMYRINHVTYVQSSTVCQANVMLLQISTNNQIRFNSSQNVEINLDLMDEVTFEEYSEFANRYHKLSVKHINNEDINK